MVSISIRDTKSGAIASDGGTLSAIDGDGLVFTMEDADPGKSVFLQRSSDGGSSWQGYGTFTANANGAVVVNASAVLQGNPNPTWWRAHT